MKGWARGAERPPAEAAEPRLKIRFDPPRRDPLRRPGFNVGHSGHPSVLPCHKSLSHRHSSTRKSESWQGVGTHEAQDIESWCRSEAARTASLSAGQKRRG